jgi:hypothetical protein
MTATTTTPTVIDNARYAWDNRSDDADPLSALCGDFVFDYRPVLDGAAIAAMELLLTEAWAQRGYEVQWGSWQQMGDGFGRSRTLPDETYWAVWDEAASKVDADALLDACDLRDAHKTYVDGE